LRCVISTALAFFLCSGGCLAAQASSSPFCVVPVRNGTPTEKDHNQAWRMVSRIITLPGVPRPIIYALNRGGVWTIDEHRAFVPFVGEFPSNLLHDKIARDPETGRFVGINAFGGGVFVLDPGQTQFARLSEIPLRPYSVEFIPRFNAFVITDTTTLHLLDRTGALKPLPIVGHPALSNTFRVFDLPAFGALLIEGSLRGPALAIRYDDGQSDLVMTLAPHDFVQSVAVEDDGSLFVRTHRDTRKLRLSRAPSKPIVQGKSFVVQEDRMRVGTARIDARSIDKIVVRDDSTKGLTELRPDGPVKIALPFDPIHERIVALTEVPEYKIVLITTNASAYALQDDGAVSEIRGARETGVSPLTDKTRMIPIRKEAVFLGRNSLNLLVDTRISGQAACN
jgi:hypothetical protein